MSGKLCVLGMIFRSRGYPINDATPPRRFDHGIDSFGGTCGETTHNPGSGHGRLVQYDHAGG